MRLTEINSEIQSAEYTIEKLHQEKRRTLSSIHDRLEQMLDWSDGWDDHKQIEEMLRLRASIDAAIECARERQVAASQLQTMRLIAG